MGNMSYCRFENTERDLRDCSENFDDFVSKSENAARIRLYKLCQQIVECFELEDIEDRIIED